MQLKWIGGGVAAAVVAAAATAGLLWGTAQSAPAASGGGNSGSAHKTGTPVIVELFTSEGCSSCPSADTVLERLARTQPVGGAHIIALGEHVDYWNRLGWRDPFSSEAYTRRQNEYATAFKSSQVYTPQMVVDGKTEFVGSDEARATEVIGQAARRPKATVDLTPSSSKNGVSLQVSVSGLTGATGSSDVYAAVVEDGLASQVRGGENAGRRLSHVAVTRSLVRVGGSANGGGAFSGKVTLPLDGGWNRANLRLVAFVQERGSRHIVGAAEAELPKL